MLRQMPSAQFATPIYRSGDGLNIRNSAQQLTDAECTQADNILFDDRGTLLKRSGITKLASAAVGTSGTLIGVGQATFVNGSTGVFTRNVLATDGTKVFYLNGASWTDITGAVSMSPGSYTIVQYLMMTNLAIGYDGQNAPYKWSGSGNIAVLGGSPPIGNISIVWNNYLWWAGVKTTPSRLYASDLGLPESYPSGNFFDVPTPNDGEPITGLQILYGNLIILKRRSIYIMQGTSIANFQLSKLNSSVGCISPFGSLQINNLVYFISDKGLYAMNLFDTKHISAQVEPRYRNVVVNQGTFGSSNQSNVQNQTMLLHYRKRNQIWSVCDASNAGQNTHDRIIVHDYLNVSQNPDPAINGNPIVSEWFIGGSVPSPACVSDFVNDTTGVITPIFSLYDKFVYFYDETASNDAGTNFTMTFKTKYYDFGDPFVFKNLRFIRTVGIFSGGAPTIAVTYSNDIGVSSTTITYSPVAGTFWDTRSVIPNTVNFPILAKYMQFKMASNDGGQFTLYEYQYELINKGRRL